MKKDAFIDLESSSVWHLCGYFSAKVSCGHNPNGQIVEHLLATELMQILCPNTIAFMGGICGFCRRNSSTSDESFAAYQ